MKHLRFVLLALSLSFAAHSAASISPEALADCMRANLPANFTVEDFSLISRDANGYKEAISGQIFFRQSPAGGPGGKASATMRIKHPAPLRDSAYLIMQTDDYLRDGLFVYLPALRRVRRISGEMADGQLFGTDITYYDFALFRSAFSGMDAVRVSDGSVDGRPSYTLSLRPPQASHGYDKATASIDAATCVPRRLEIYQDGRLHKTLSVPLEAIQTDGERWYPAEFTMRNLQSGSSTTFRTLELRSGEPLPDALFNPATFYRAR